MPAELFVDTSGWYALAVASVREHAAVRDALAERLRAGVRVVTTNLVVAETHALLLRRTSRAIALSFVREVRRPPNVIVSTTPDIEERAIDGWLVRYDDQDFSFTDAVSFAVMRDRAIQDALALDQHFRAAGFTTLP